MTSLAIRPFNQAIRIFALRASFLAILPLTLLVTPALGETMLGEVAMQIGVFLIFGGILGRFWSILYIGGFKNTTVVCDGPYSICRHPLYLFSTVAAVGFGLMLQSLVLTVFIAVVVFGILNGTASREERFLKARFGDAYTAYAATTPRIVPAISRFSTSHEVTFTVRHLRTNFADALVFAALIPLSELIAWARDVHPFPTIPLV